MYLHSASWSSGKEPRSGGDGLTLTAPPPGAPNPDIPVAGVDLVLLILRANLEVKQALQATEMPMSQRIR